MTAYQVAFVNHEDYRDYIEEQYGKRPPKVSACQATRYLGESVGLAKHFTGLAFIQDPQRPAHN